MLINMKPAEYKLKKFTEKNLNDSYSNISLDSFWTVEPEMWENEVTEACQKRETASGMMIWIHRQEHWIHCLHCID